MKRTVERVAAAGAEVGEAPANLNDDVPPEAPAPRAGRKAQALSDVRGTKTAEERAFVPSDGDVDAHAQGRQSLKEILARAEGKPKGKAKAEKPAEVEPTQEQLDALEQEAEEPEVAPENDNDDPDANPPDEEQEGEETEAEEPAAAKSKTDDGAIEYLTPAQRAELSAKMGEKRRERQLEEELKKAQAEADKYRGAKTARELLAAAGHDPAVALEELLVGGGQQPAADDMTPRERELLGRLATLEKTIADSQKQQTTAQVQAARGAAVKRIETLLTAEHFPMVAAMGAFDDVMTEGEALYDATEEDNNGYGLRVMQVAADNIEKKLRAKYPAIAAKLAAAAGEPAEPAAKQPAKAKPTVGSRSAPAAGGKPATGSDLPYDESRHAVVKERFFGRAHR